MGCSDSRPNNEELMVAEDQRICSIPSKNIVIINSCKDIVSFSKNKVEKRIG